MSAFTRLWRRAFLWRLCLYVSVISCALTLVYPPPYLLRAVPPLKPMIAEINHLLGRSPTPQAPTPDSTASNDAAPPPGAAAPAGTPSAASDPANTEQVATPPITADLQGGIPFAGRVLPLPAGIWHPVLSTQAGPHRELLTNVLVRADRGIVTGVIVAHGSTASIPANSVSDLENGCHDDRNYLSKIVTGGPQTFECWTTNYTMLEQHPMTNNQDVNEAFERLHVLGFPLPPLMLMATWNRADASTDGGVNVENVTILISPATPGTTKLPNPPEAYLKEALHSVPSSGELVNRLNQWMTNWVPVLRDGYLGKVKIEDIPPIASHDPAAP